MDYNLVVHSFIVTWVQGAALTPILIENMKILTELKHHIVQIFSCLIVVCFLVIICFFVQKSRSTQREDSVPATEELACALVEDSLLAQQGELQDYQNATKQISGGVSALLSAQENQFLADQSESADVVFSKQGVNLTSGEELPGEYGEEENCDEENVSEYENLAIAKVNDYVNVRLEPNTESQIVGKMYDGSVAEIVEIIGENQEWLRIKSGQVEGYIKSEFFIWGDAASEVIDQYVGWNAQVVVERLNIRAKASGSSSRVSYADFGENLKVTGLVCCADRDSVEEEEIITSNLLSETQRALLQENPEADCIVWLQIQIGENQTGYIAARYVTLSETFTYAKSIEEEKEEAKRRAELSAREKKSEAEAGENTQKAAVANTSYSTNSELRSNLVSFALGYVGYPYVHGGSSLATGTDCSGFTSLIYKEYGYSISRTPSGQYSSAGRSVSIDEIQIGDIICYGSSSCTHVAIYIGGGQIVHAANSRKGVVVYDMYYDNILGIRNVID